MNTLPPEIIEQILLYVPTAQIPNNMLYINKQITKILMSTYFWVNKCRYINPKVWHVLREFNEKELRYILWYTSLASEEGIMYSTEGRYQSITSKIKNNLMLCTGWLIGANPDKLPSDIRYISSCKYSYEYVFLKTVSALEIPLFYIKSYSSNKSLNTSINIADDIKNLRSNLKIIGKKSREVDVPIVPKESKTFKNKMLIHISNSSFILGFGGVNICFDF